MPWFSSKKKDNHTGFMDDLSEEQQQALEAFRKIIVDENLTNDPRYDDYYLLRFLRARQFNLEKTMKMFTNFLAWRVEHRADEAMVIYKCPNVEKARPLYKHGYHGVDLLGQPFYVDMPCKFDIDDLLAIVDRDELYVYYIREYEKLLHIRMPACSQAAGKKIEQSFSLLNIDGFTMGKLREKSREFVKIAINIGSDYYPEIMYKTYIINAPFLFKGAWAIIKPFIDEKTRKKISILGSSYTKDLFKHVDPSNVPAEIGGECTCSEHEGGCFLSDKGPWNEFPGDDFGEAAKERILEEEKKEMSIPVPMPNISSGSASYNSASNIPAPVPVAGIPMPTVAVSVGENSSGMTEEELKQVQDQMKAIELNSKFEADKTESLQNHASSDGNKGT
jgi:hypothetical protein